MPELQQLVTQEAYAFLIIFMRLAAAMALFPGFGDNTVPMNVQVLVSLLFSFVALPVVGPDLPPPPASMIGLGSLIASEVLIGTFIGLVPRLLTAGLGFAGHIISILGQMANAQIFNPQLDTSGAIVSTFLTLGAITALFATDLHHLMILAVVDSYTLFPPGEFLPLGDSASILTTFLDASFLIGLQLAGPVILVSVVMNVTMGVMGRLAPQIQVFFIIQPLITWMAVLFFSITVTTMMLLWVGFFEEHMLRFLQPF